MNTLIQYPNTAGPNSLNLFCLDRMLETGSLNLSSTRKLHILKFKVKDLNILSDNTAHCMNLTDLLPLPFDKQYISFFGIDDSIQYDIIRTFTIGLLACYLLDFSLEIFCKSSIAIFIDDLPKFVTYYKTHSDTPPGIYYTLIIDPTNKITLSNHNDYSRLKDNLPLMPVPISRGGMINSLKDKQLNILVMH